MPFYRHDTTKAVTESDKMPGPGWTRIAKGDEPVVDESVDADAATEAAKADRKK